MAPSKNTKEEKEKKKSKVKAKAKETKPTKPETEKEANPSPKKDNNNNNNNNNKKKTGIQNGTVCGSEDEVVITTPATSNDNGSQEDSETEQDSRMLEAKKPNKSGKKMQLDDDDDEDEKEDSKICNFPMKRIKRIFKTQSSDFAITGEAAFLVNKATDKFLEQFCEDAYKCCVKDRKKSLAYKHLASVVSEQMRYDFLSDFVPKKIKAEDALAQRKLAEEGKNRILETR